MTEQNHTGAPAAPDATGAASDPRKADLSVEIIDGRIVIAIGVETLKIAVEAGPAGAEWDAEVTNPDLFARELREQLLLEQEDGTTPVHEMFDKAAAAAIEDGAEGVRLAGEETDNEC